MTDKRFQGFANPFTAGRYHSLIVDRDSLPSCLKITAETKEGEVMGIRHENLSGGRYSIPSRIDPDAAGKKDYPEFFKHGPGKEPLQ